MIREKGEAPEDVCDLRAVTGTERDEGFKEVNRLRDGPIERKETEGQGSCSKSSADADATREGGGDARGLEIDTSFVSDVPFELVGKIASACAVTEARHVESRATSSRHLLRCDIVQQERPGGVILMIEWRERTASDEEMVMSVK